MSNLTQKSQPSQAVLDQIIGLYNQGQLEQTVLLSESLAKQYPNALILYDILGAAYMGLKNTEKTIEIYQKALQLNPNHTDAYNNMGMALYDQGRFDEAVDSYQKAIKLEPGFADAHYNLGNALKQTGNLKQAIGSYRASLVINPNDAEVLLHYGNTLKNYGDFDHAIEIYAQALKIDPNSAAAQTNMDNADEEKAEIDKNVAGYARIAKLEIGSAEIVSFTGTLLKARGFLDAAIDNYEQAIKIKPDYADAYYNMGNVLNDKGDLDAAIDSYKKAIKIKPDHVEAYTNMGNALKDQGKLEAAIATYDKVSDKTSIARALECTYFMENYDDFNVRLNSIAEKDPTNIRVAAMSAFAAHQRQNEDPYPFCANPIDLIKFSNIKNHISDSDSFISSILNEMNERDSIWEPQNQTTKGGFQTNPKLFDKSSPNMKILEDIFKRELSLFRAEFQNNESIIFQKWPDAIKIAAWYVRLLQNGHQDSHIHPAGWVSGVFYLKTVEAPIQHEGAIEFGLHGYDYPVINEDYPRRLYEPLNGDLVLFPSSLFHKTIPVIKDAERCVIAFDLVP